MRELDEDSVSDAPSLPIDSVEDADRNDERLSSAMEAFVSAASSLNPNQQKKGMSTRSGVVSFQRNPLAERKVQTSARSETPVSNICARSETAVTSSLQVFHQLDSSRDLHHEDIFSQKPLRVASEAQTDIAQFQIDEIMIKLLNIQQQRVALRTPATRTMERSVETSLSLLELINGEAQQDDKSVQCAVALMDIGTNTSSSVRECGTDSFTEDSKMTHEDSKIPLEDSEGCLKTQDLLLRESSSSSGRTMRVSDSSLKDSGMATQESGIYSRDSGTSTRDSPISEKESSNSTRESTTSPRQSRAPLRESELVSRETDASAIEPVFSSTASGSSSINYTFDLKETSSQTNHSPLVVNKYASDPTERATMVKLANTDYPIAQLQPEPKEVIIQTDDSYLKNARRLNALRSNRMHYLPVCAAEPLLGSASQTPSLSNSSRSFHIDLFRDRQRSLRLSAKKAKSERSEKEGYCSVAAQTYPSVSSGMEEMEVPIWDERSRSISPALTASDSHSARGSFVRRRGQSATSSLQRKTSLPAGVPRGRVSDFIAKHERGNPNPAKAKPPVTIIRQHSLGVGDEEKQADRT